MSHEIQRGVLDIDTKRIDEEIEGIVADDGDEYLWLDGLSAKRGGEGLSLRELKVMKRGLDVKSNLTLSDLEEGKMNICRKVKAVEELSYDCNQEYTKLASILMSHYSKLDTINDDQELRLRQMLLIREGLCNIRRILEDHVQWDDMLGDLESNLRKLQLGAFTVENFTEFRPNPDSQKNALIDMFNSSDYSAGKELQAELSPVAVNVYKCFNLVCKASVSSMGESEDGRKSPDKIVQLKRYVILLLDIQARFLKDLISRTVKASITIKEVEVSLLLEFLVNNVLLAKVVSTYSLYSSDTDIIEAWEQLKVMTNIPEVKEVATTECGSLKDRYKYCMATISQLATRFTTVVDGLGRTEKKFQDAISQATDICYLILQTMMRQLLLHIKQDVVSSIIISEVMDETGFKEYILQVEDVFEILNEAEKVGDLSSVDGFSMLQSGLNNQGGIRTRVMEMDRLTFKLIWPMLEYLSESLRVSPSEHIKDITFTEGVVLLLEDVSKDIEQWRDVVQRVMKSVEAIGQVEALCIILPFCQYVLRRAVSRYFTNIQSKILSLCSFLESKDRNHIVQAIVTGKIDIEISSFETSNALQVFIDKIGHIVSIMREIIDISTNAFKKIAEFSCNLKDTVKRTNDLLENEGDIIAGFDINVEKLKSLLDDPTSISHIGVINDDFRNFLKEVLLSLCVSMGTPILEMFSKLDIWVANPTNKASLRQTILVTYYLDVSIVVVNALDSLRGLDKSVGISIIDVYKPLLCDISKALVDSALRVLKLSPHGLQQLAYDLDKLSQFVMRLFSGIRNEGGNLAECLNQTQRLWMLRNHMYSTLHHNSDPSVQSFMRKFSLSMEGKPVDSDIIEWLDGALQASLLD